MDERIQWVFFAGGAKVSSMRRAIAYRLAERMPVLVVRDALSVLRNRRWPGLSKRLRRRCDVPLLREYSPVHLPGRVPFIGTLIQTAGARLLRRELGRVMAEFGRARRIVCYDSPSQFSLVGTLCEDLSVYLAIDDRTLTVWGEPIPGENEAERALLSRVNRVICVSDVLAEVLRSRAPSGRDLRIDVLTNGYDERVFNPARAYEEPRSLMSVPRPRILVAGHVSERIDWKGVAEAAALRPEWSWVFVGPADNGMTERICRISAETRANMGLHSPVDYEAIPAWVFGCEACAVPYRLNEFTLASSPLKAIEYLGAGAPLLSTRIPSLETFGAAIAWVREGDGASYASALDRLIVEGRAQQALQKRLLAVCDQSWTVKADRFCELLGL